MFKATMVVALMSSIIGFSSSGFSDQASASKPFTGFITGANIGISHMEVNTHQGSVSDTDMNYEVLLGYRVQTDNQWVWGIEGALGDSRVNIDTANSQLDFDYAWHWTLTLGKVIGDNSEQLIYLKAGVGGIQVDPVVHGVAQAVDNYQGGYFGLGYERAVSESFSLRVQATYIEYDPSFDQQQLNMGFLYKF